MQGLHLVGIRHSYSTTQVLDAISLTVPAGELVCLLGPSGCGKTTLLRIAAGMERLQAGSVTIDERIVAEPDLQLPPEERRIGYMFQDYALFPHLTVLDNVTFGLFRQDRTSAVKRAMEMLDQVHMTQHADKHPHTLSGGQQQRVALARVLAPEPSVVLLDEPFSGLDSNMRARIREQTLAVLKHTNVATLMVTHDTEEAMFMADRIKVMGENGRILQAGSPEDIYYRPVDEYVARLFGPINAIDGVVSGGVLDSSFGAIAMENVEDGALVKVLIRPEGLVLSNGDGVGVLIDIVSTHLLGDNSLVRFQCCEGVHKGVEFEARIVGAFDPTEKRQSRVRVDPRHVFRYPRKL
ncbi:MAG: ABC transporter ATP-binding protein [Rhodospirillaceae bacterium]|jgi:iron(III) transport system ATP-binding protein|nr:ABC transporter ATP-binding protein [Rhodospirillaceae bacterium]MBT5667739.1 ABC transporter ATP-binding protein [Rhodospirillaceae bacterium]MBT5809751.1 ABC transporter ATP-binding protein [Rhodospirillaceae bacterium]